MFLQWLCSLNSNFPEKKILGCEISMVKIGQSSSKLRFWVGGFLHCTPEGIFPWETAIGYYHQMRSIKISFAIFFVYRNTCMTKNIKADKFIRFAITTAWRQHERHLDFNNSFILIKSHSVLCVYSCVLKITFIWIIIPYFCSATLHLRKYCHCPGRSLMI